MNRLWTEGHRESMPSPHRNTQSSWYCWIYCSIPQRPLGFHRKFFSSLCYRKVCLRVLVPDEGSPGRHNGSCNKPPLGCYKHVCMCEYTPLLPTGDPCWQTHALHPVTGQPFSLTAPAVLFQHASCGSPPDICLLGLFLEAMVPTSSAARKIQIWRVDGASLPVHVLHVSGISM